MGSSSDQVSIYPKRSFAKGLVERIGEDMGIYTYKSQPYTKKNLNVLIHAKGIENPCCTPIMGVERNWWCWSVMVARATRSR